MIPRYLEAQIKQDLDRKMVFVAGPRQVGKTTLARSILSPQDAYLSWDVPEHREQILRGEWPPAATLTLDEIHKYRSWRAVVKGLWDSRELRSAEAVQRLLVTGSGRLDLYRYGGDSLQGRYHLLRLHPFSYAELAASGQADLETLFELGGFPEPLLSGSQTEARRWSREYRSQLVYEEIRSLESIVDLGKLELLALRLPELVGSPLSVNSLREDLQVAHKTVESWLSALERLYALFRIEPFGAPHLRAVKKERKHYLFDWILVNDPGARFENLVAVHLLKWVHYRQDCLGEEVELRYFRDVDRREVDFVITAPTPATASAPRPELLIEVKLDDADIGRGLRYLKARFENAQAWQISLRGKKNYVTREGIRVAPAVELLKGWS